jgi:ApbE superfamily uncharacterized protein (UPF0280 family)
MSQNWQGAVFARLATGRWHFQQGPIDLILDVDAPVATRDRCIALCREAFQDILPGLVAELPSLRRPASERLPLKGPVAARMGRACAPYADEVFITPMAAVAGSVADELIGVFHRADVSRACINNGGDIALHLAPGARYQVGVWSQIERWPGASTCDSGLDGRFRVDADMPVRGVATSGWRGRSFSLGVADSVTVLAHDAAAADAAATLIANEVDCDAPGIVRAPASQLKDDSDLGDRLVTVEVPALAANARTAALARGRLAAERWRDRGLIHAAALFLQGSVEVVQPRPAAAMRGMRMAAGA